MLSAVLQAKGKNNMFYLCVQCDKLITHIEVEIRLAGQEGNGGEVCQKVASYLPVFAWQEDKRQ